MDETVGERLRRLRLASGLSQRALESPGVSYAYISRIEGGTRTPSVKALRQLAPKLGVSVRYLETGDDAIEVAVRLSDVNAELDRRGVDPWESFDPGMQRAAVRLLIAQMPGRAANAMVAANAKLAEKVGRGSGS